MRNTANVTGGKPIAIWSQSISGVSGVNPLVAFYDIHDIYDIFDDQINKLGFFRKTYLLNYWEKLGTWKYFSV
jgi:hypothetical protein